MQEFGISEFSLIESNLPTQMMTNISRQLTTGALAIAGSVAAFTGAASASTLITVSGGSFDNSLEVTEINQTGTLSKFDSSLGDLVSATLTLSGDFLQSITGTNTSQQSQTARISTSTELLFSIAGFGGTLPLIEFAENTGFLSYGVGQTRAFGPFSEQLTDSVTFTGTDLAFFDSLGEDFEVACESFSSLTVTGGGGNIDSTQETQASCHGSIEYVYSVHQGTPEPSTMLAILAVAGAGAFARRKS
jgi:hypothetical protein